MVCRRRSDHVLLPSGADMKKGPARTSGAFQGWSATDLDRQATCATLMMCLIASCTTLVGRRDEP